MNSTSITIGRDDQVSSVTIGETAPLAFLGGPCAIERSDHARMMAERIGAICDKLDIPWIYKSCYDKDCRSAPDSFHGIGLDEGSKILSSIRTEFGIPIVSDFSDVNWVKPTGEVIDLTQVSAYLCRQTTILRAAGTTGFRFISKKGNS